LRLARVVALRDAADVDVRRAGRGGRTAYRVVQGRLDTAQVRHVALRDRHLGEAALRPRQDPRVTEDRDPGMGRLVPYGVECGDQGRVGLVPDVAPEPVAVPVPAGTPLTQRRDAGDTALHDGPDEGVVVVAADGHRHQLGTPMDGVELRGDTGVLALL